MNMARGSVDSTPSTPPAHQPVCQASGLQAAHHKRHMALHDFTLAFTAVEGSASHSTFYNVMRGCIHKSKQHCRAQPLYCKTLDDRDTAPALWRQVHWRQSAFHTSGLPAVHHNQHMAVCEILAGNRQPRCQVAMLLSMQYQAYTLQIIAAMH